MWALRVFEGYDWVTLLVVANLAFSGLLVSWVMKFADSILKARGPCQCMTCKLFSLQPWAAYRCLARGAVSLTYVQISIPYAQRPWESSVMFFMDNRETS